MTKTTKEAEVVPAPLPPAEPTPGPGPGGRLGAGLLRPERVDPQDLRLGGTVLLAAAALFIFRGAATAQLATTLLVAGVTLGALWTGFHRLGIRTVDDYWPGVRRGLAGALLLFVLLPPGLPLGLVGALTAATILVEGRLRQAAMPLALGGVGIAWLVAWGWHARAGLGYLAPFDLRMLEDPVRLWSQFGIAVDPTRLYTGNVAGPLGSTSFGAVAIVTLALAYARDISWEYLAGFFLVLLGGGVLVGEPLTLAGLQGPALAFAGLLAAERRRLPHHAAWRTGAGVAAAGLAVLLQREGMGVDSYGVGVCVVAGGWPWCSWSGSTNGHCAAQRQSEPRAAPRQPTLQAWRYCSRWVGG